MILSVLGMARVDIANSQNVAKVRMMGGIARAHTAHANAADLRPIIRRIVGKRLFAPTDIRHNSAGGHRRDRLLQKITPGM